MGPRHAVEPLEEQVGRAASGVGHVDMGVGAVAHQRVGAIDHCLRDVGVQVQARHQRQVRPDHAPHTGEEFAFAVVEVFGDHCAVEVEVDGIGVRVADTFDDHRGNALERVLGYVCRRLGGRPHGGDEPVAGALHLLDEPGDGQVPRHHGLEDLAAALQAWPAFRPLEILERRLRGREGVGLVLEPADRDAHQCLSVEKAKLRPGAAAKSARVYSC